MVMYSSKTPRDLNHDPMPYLWPEERRTSRLTTGPLRSMFPEGNGAPLIHDPRPEFDHVQHNPVNRRLIWFRSEVILHRNAGPEVGLSMPSLASGWVDRNDFGSDVTDAEFEHSQKVLTRLASLAEKESA